MKATGIVRRIDDLGRVVVPKEIRRTLKIREGDPLEIFTEKEGEIVLKKYSPMGEIKGFAQQYAESLATFVPHIVIVTDRGQVLATAGGGKELLNHDITKQLEEIFKNKDLKADINMNAPDINLDLKKPGLNMKIPDINIDKKGD